MSDAKKLFFTIMHIANSISILVLMGIAIFSSSFEHGTYYLVFAILIKMLDNEDQRKLNRPDINAMTIQHL